MPHFRDTIYTPFQGHHLYSISGILSIFHFRDTIYAPFQGYYLYSISGMLSILHFRDTIYAPFQGHYLYSILHFRDTIYAPLQGHYLYSVSGTLSMLQMFLLSYNYSDWTVLTGDITKIGLSLLVCGYDCVMLFQHYVVYGGGVATSQTGPINSSPEQLLQDCRDDEMKKPILS